MKKTLLTLMACLATAVCLAGNILNEGFEYANHDFTKPVGWICDDDSWLCGYLEKDHNRKPHTGNWYAFSNAADSWMFMPMYLIEEMYYRFSLWAISDGDFQLEIWAGSAPNADNMHTRFLSETVAHDDYERISVYVETIPPDSQYVGIRALAGNGGTHLTIDDIEVDMVQQYIFEAEAVTGDTAMYPGTQGSFHFLVHNVGYDELDITMYPSNEFFTNFTCIANGVNGMTFHAMPDETVEVTMQATLRPEIEPGTVSWLDILMTIPCNCNTAMVTFWVTPLDLTQTQENNTMDISVFPNPTTDFVTVEAEGLQQVSLMDMTGKTLRTLASSDPILRMNTNGLRSGSYLLRIHTEKGTATRIIVIK